MTDAENLFGDEHVRRYRETGGEVGHEWKKGSKILLLTTKGRTSGELRTSPLIYEADGDRYVIVASKGGAAEDPGWYRNLAKEPDVELQVRDEVFPARARTAEGERSATASGSSRRSSGRTTTSTRSEPTGRSRSSCSSGVERHFLANGQPL